MGYQAGFMAALQAIHPIEYTYLRSCPADLFLWPGMRSRSRALRAYSSGQVRAAAPCGLRPDKKITPFITEKREGIILLLS